MLHVVNACRACVEHTFVHMIRKHEYLHRKHQIPDTTYIPGKCLCVIRNLLRMYDMLGDRITPTIHSSGARDNGVQYYRRRPIYTQNAHSERNLASKIHTGMITCPNPVPREKRHL